jgi:hypothetical protein
MSDFDTVLERLLTDPPFKAALAADPAAALAGYRLSEDERELLYAQVSTDTGGDRQVEQRTSKASLFGLLAPLAGAAGLTHDSGVGHAVGTAAHAGLGAVEAHAGLSPAGPQAGLSPADHAGFGPADDTAGVVQAGDASGVGGIVVDDTGVNPAGGPLGHGVTALPGQSGFGAAPPPDYHPHVDVDGDGHWDQYTVRSRSDGGLDIVADMNHDGRPDFIGHDDNADGIIDRADYDRNFDGQFETHMRDVNGDGWMDVTDG